MAFGLPQEKRDDGRQYLVDCKSGKEVKLQRTKHTYILYVHKGRDCIAAGEHDEEPSFCDELMAILQKPHDKKDKMDKQKDKEKVKEKEKDGKDAAKKPKRSDSEGGNREKKELKNKKEKKEKPRSADTRSRSRGQSAVPRRRCSKKTSPTTAAKSPLKPAALKGMSGGSWLKITLVVCSDFIVL